MNKNWTIQNKNDRIPYIDALRGLAMIMVVFVHVEIFCFFNFEHTTPLMNILSSIHMPLFFFISGLCTYKPDRRYGLNRIKNDFIRLIVPAVVIGLLYTCFRKGENLIFFLSNSMKAGYWFTISLFEVLLIYYAARYFIPQNDKKLIVILWVISGLLFVLKLPFKTISSLEIIGNYLCLHQTFNYFIFFVLGISVAKYKDKIEVLLHNNYFTSSVMFLYVFGTFSLYGVLPKYAGVSVFWRVLGTLGETLLGVLGVLMLFVFFYKMQGVIDRQGVLSRFLSTIGNSTLQIYLIHYFFLPRLPQLGAFLINYPGVVSESFLSLVVSFQVIATSLIVNEIIRRVSPFLGNVFLGNQR